MLHDSGGWTQFAEKMFESMEVFSNRQHHHLLHGYTTSANYVRRRSTALTDTAWGVESDSRCLLNRGTRVLCELPRIADVSGFRQPRDKIFLLRLHSQSAGDRHGFGSTPLFRRF